MSSLTSESSLSSDLIYSTLSDNRRRYTIHYLKQQDEPVSVRDLVEQVAAWENDKQVNELTSKERKRVYTALYQSHLPTLNKQGIVDYDSDRGIVKLSDALADTDIYLEVVPRANIPWSAFYLGLSVLCGLLLLLAWTAVYPFNQVPQLGWGVIILFAFATASFVQLYQSRRMRIGDEGAPPEVKSRS